MRTPTLIDRTGEPSAKNGCCQIYVEGGEDRSAVYGSEANDEAIGEGSPPGDDKPLAFCGKKAELYLVRASGGNSGRTLQFLCDDHALRMMSHTGREVLPVKALNVDRYQGTEVPLDKSKETPIMAETDFNTTSNQSLSGGNRFGIESNTPMEFPKNPAPPMGGAPQPVTGNGGGTCIIPPGKPLHSIDHRGGK